MIGTQSESKLNTMEQCLKDVHVFNAEDPDPESKTLVNDILDLKRNPYLTGNPHECPNQADDDNANNGTDHEPNNSRSLSQACYIPTSDCNNRKKRVNFSDTTKCSY